MGQQLCQQPHQAPLHSKAPLQQPCALRCACLNSNAVLHQLLGSCAAAQGSVARKAPLHALSLPGIAGALQGQPGAHKLQAERTPRLLPLGAAQEGLHEAVKLQQVRPLRVMVCLSVRWRWLWLWG